VTSYDALMAAIDDYVTSCGGTPAEGTPAKRAVVVAIVRFEADAEALAERIAAAHTVERAGT